MPPGNYQYRVYISLGGTKNEEITVSFPECIPPDWNLPIRSQTDQSKKLHRLLTRQKVTRAIARQAIAQSPLCQKALLYCTDDLNLVYENGYSTNFNIEIEVTIPMRREKPIIITNRYTFGLKLLCDSFGSKQGC